MRKHGWQLPYHPLQVVAVAVFLALGFAFYVFFAPFVGRKLFQYIAIGLYTPLTIVATTVICIVVCERDRYWRKVVVAKHGSSWGGLCTPEIICGEIMVSSFGTPRLQRDLMVWKVPQLLNGKILTIDNLMDNLNCCCLKGFTMMSFLISGEVMASCAIWPNVAHLIGKVHKLFGCIAAADPADPGVFKSKKYLKIPDSKKHARLKESKLGGDSTSSIQDANAATIGGNPIDKSTKDMDTTAEDYAIETEKKNESSYPSSCCVALLPFIPCAFIHNCSSPHEESSQQQLSEDGMFYCSLCEVEVFKYSKHCRVCDKCVDHFDHHCRWLNNCIGKRNYRKFFILMVSALVLVLHGLCNLDLRLQLILQWSTGILVLICCFLEHKTYSVDISSKLGSSFTIVPFVIVVAVCTILAMIATLPLAQLFFFHILLIKKGISTYDYIIALREQEQQGIGGQQSPQLSHASSLTGLSSGSSFTTFHRGAWCTPPRLFLEDQFDVVPPDSASVSSLGKKMAGEEPIKRKNPAAVKISPWALARLNAEEISKAAAEARKKSKILQPVVRREASFGQEANSSFGSSGRRMVLKPDNNNRKRTSKRVRLPADLPLANVSAEFANSNGNDIVVPETSTSLAPLQLEARSAFRTNRAMSSSTGIVSSSPESSLDSPDLHPFRVSSGTEEVRQLTGLSAAGAAAQMGIPLSSSTSDGYEASGGEDSDRVPSRTVQRSTNWSNLLFSSDQDERVVRLKASTSSGHANNRNL
ncbi:DHHC-type zinc finger family protein [Actinidia rufa]|uniref:S-acyltransferase n=1 Tax=Actinidia rufa TaxID=165716 RepID=A0A7J0H679_9ERIC|nr:DHHC-type zinc finger family protein [Actinidia rufa]